MEEGVTYCIRTRVDTWVPPTYIYKPGVSSLLVYNLNLLDLHFPPICGYLLTCYDNYYTLHPDDLYYIKPIILLLLLMARVSAAQVLIGNNV